MLDLRIRWMRERGEREEGRKDRGGHADSVSCSWW